jgi:hypothetical protein
VTSAIAIVPLVVIVPPESPVPAVMPVTVPPAELLIGVLLLATLLDAGWAAAERARARAGARATVAALAKANTGDAKIFAGKGFDWNFKEGNTAIVAVTGAKKAAAPKK